MLSGNINIEDDDWDSVRQGYAALTRDLERIYLSFGMGGNDLGGGVPKSANDQTIAQDGNYGFQAVTTDMLSGLERRINGLRSVSMGSLHAYGDITPSVSFNNASYSSVVGSLSGSLSSNVFTANASGIYTIVSSIGGGWSGSQNVLWYTTITRDSGSNPTKATSGVFQIPLFTLSSGSITNVNAQPQCSTTWTGFLQSGETMSITHYFNSVTGASSVYNRLLVSSVTV